MEANEKKWIAYLRVSTDDKGQTTEQQLEAIKRAAEREGAAIINFESIAEYTDKKSGKLPPEEREGLRKAMKLCRKTGAHIVCAKHDRLARAYSVAELLANDNSVIFHFLNAPDAALYDPTLRMVYFGFDAEGYRRALSVATKAKMQLLAEALQRANAFYAEGKSIEEIIALEPMAADTIKRGHYPVGAWRLGTPTAPVNEAQRSAGCKRAANTNEHSLAAKEDLAEWLKSNPRNYSAAAKFLNSIGRSTPRGGDFTAQAVKNLMARFGI